MDELEHFKKFMKQREEASQAYVQGNPQPLNQIVTSIYPATFFGPRGGYTEGAQEVASKYEQDAKNFDQGSNFHFEILDMAASNGIAYWVGFMKGEARIKGKLEAIPMNLRVTEIFRREGDEWKMVHRHADPLAKPKQS